MARLLIKTRGATEEEIEGMQQLLQEHQLACYHTDAGRWRIGVDALWIANEEDYPRARELVEQFQQDFSRERREHWQQLQAQGQAPTFIQGLFMQPVKVVLALVGIAAIAAISIVPFVYL